MSDYGFRSVRLEDQYATGSRSQEAILSTNRVLKNTYLLLSMTLLWSAAAAGIAMALDMSHMVGLILLLVGFGCLFWVHKTADSSTGIVAIFAFTGCLGASLGPTLNYYIATLSNGTEIVMQALGGTGLIFLTLSGYVLTTRKDFSFMRGFLVTGLMIVLLAMVGNLIMGLFGMYMSALSLAISSAVILLMSGFILFDTSRIIHGGETNYIRATVSLYLNIYNLFIHLLHLLAVLSGSRD
jgi:modulator of FtsH protease